MEAHTEHVFRQLEEFIKKRNFEEAFEQGLWYVSEAQRQPINNARVWFQLALLANLTKHDPTPFQEKARLAPDYTTTLEGDMIRDDALRAIRTRKFDRAQQLIDEVARLHVGNPNRVACLLMVEARLASAQGNFAEANALHQQAADLWYTAGPDADPEWIRTNQFHWLRTAIMMRKKDLAKVLLQNVVKGEPTGSNRITAGKLMLRFGKPAVIAYGVYERLKS